MLKEHDRKEIMVDAMWSVSYMSDAGEKAIIHMIEHGTLEPLVDKLSHEHNNVVLPGVRALGNFVTGDDTETQTVIDAGVIPHLYNLMGHSDGAIRKEACWTISNICAGTPVQVGQIIEHGIFDRLVDLVQNDVFEIKREAGWSISNTTALKEPSIIQEVAQRKGVEAMCQVLKEKCDPKTIVVLLEGIRNCLQVGQKHFLDDNGENPFTIVIEECGGLDTIEDLQTHKNMHVYELTLEIIENFFQVEEVDLGTAEASDMKLEF